MAVVAQKCAARINRPRFLERKQNMKKKTIVDVTTPVAVSPASEAAAPRRKGSPVMSTLAVQYQGLSDDGKAQWNHANNRVQSPGDPANNDKLGTSGWTLFYACNAALMSANQSITLQPESVSIPQPLPGIRVQITYTGVGQTPVITLLPYTTMPYPAGPKIALWATQAVPQGNATTSTEFKGRAFRHIGEITGGLPLAGVNVAAQYLSVFPSVPASCKIGFKLMAYNPGGYHTEKLFTVGLTPMLSMETAAEGDSDLHLAAE